MSYSTQLRLVVAAAHDECGSSADVAEEFGCLASWVRRLMQREWQTGSLEPRPPKRPDRSKLDQADMGKLAAVIDERPDLTLAELATQGGGTDRLTNAIADERQAFYDRIVERDPRQARFARGWRTRTNDFRAPFNGGIQAVP